MPKSQSLFNLKVAVKPSSASSIDRNTLSPKWLKVILPFILLQKAGATDGLNNGAITGICLGAVFLVGCVSVCVAYGARRYCKRTDDNNAYKAIGEEKDQENPIVEGIKAGGNLMSCCLGT